MSVANLVKIIIPVTLAFLITNSLLAQQADELITIDEPVTEDLYLAGESIHILAEITGDLVAAGRRIDLASRVSSDFTAAAEHVSVFASVGDDARLAGRIVTISAQISDDAIVAGETINLMREGIIGGRMWAAGRNININGRIGRELRAIGQFVSISGNINGDVLLTAEQIEILPGTRIAGDFKYKSPNKAFIASGAEIGGAIQHEEFDSPDLEETAVLPIFLGLLVSLLFSVGVIYWLFPGFMRRTSEIAQRKTFKCIGLGLSFFLVTPLLALFLLIIVLGIPLGIILFALYFVSLFIGLSIGLVVISDGVLRLLRKGTETTAAWRMLALLLAVVAFAVLQLIPFIGELAMFGLVFVGSGALSLQAYQSWKAD